VTKPNTKETNAVTQENFIIELFCRVDDMLPKMTEHLQAKLSKGELVTVGLLMALKGASQPAFYRWVSQNWKLLFSALPERTRFFRRLKMHRKLTEQFLAEPTIFGVIDSYGIELCHPIRQIHQPNRHRIGKKGFASWHSIVGGEINIADGKVTVAMTQAVHSSSVFNPKATATEAERAYGGNPAGFVLIIKNGPTIYHSGDTTYFKDMETVGEEYQIDLALLNIGGHFGMEPRMAAKAAKSVRAKLAIPQHYATFPGIGTNADGFAGELKTSNIPFYEMKPGETILYSGKQMVKR